MYLPRSLISHLYLHLLRTHHPLSPPVLILVALEPDALCACRILTALLKRDFIPHKIQPIAGYADLSRAGEKVVRPMRLSEGGSGGVVVCLGVGGLVDLGSTLGSEMGQDEEDTMSGVEVWVIDSRRPWNLGNVFGGKPCTRMGINGPNTERGVENGRISRNYKPGQGGIVVFDDGDIEEELEAEREAYSALEQMPDVEDNGSESDESEVDGEEESAIDAPCNPLRKKRKSWSDREEEDEGSDGEEGRRSRRRRTSYSSSSSVGSSPTRPAAHGLLSAAPRLASDMSNPTSADIIAVKEPSPRTLRRRLIRLRRKHESVLRKYYELGTSYSEPVSSLMYSLASELGREDNDLLWYAIVGVGSLELYGRNTGGVGISYDIKEQENSGWGGERGERIRQTLRDEVRRLNPLDLNDVGREANRGEAQGVIPTTASSPTDKSIRLSPEPRFMLIRHWSLYDSMLHSPYLSARLHIWSDAGRKRLHKLLAKMGVSLTQCKQSYTHMDMELKRGLRERLLKYAPLYGLDGLVPPTASANRGREGWGFVRSWGWKACLSAADVGVVVGALLEMGKAGVTSLESGGWERGRENRELVDEEGHVEGEEWVSRFFDAYDALENVESLKEALPTAMHLLRAILRTGTSLIEKRQIRHLRAFRMAVVKDGPDVALFTHPSALTKLALWVGEAIAQQEKESRGKLGRGGKGTPLVIAGLNERRGVYVVVGTGGGGGASDVISKKERLAKKAEKQKAREAREKERERKRAEREQAGDEEEEAETEEEAESEEEDEESEGGERYGRGYGRNRFGNAFQEVVEETNARVKIDSFEHCVVEVKKEDLTGFLESLSVKAVIG
ncbi:MAG: hypothetical protein M1829_000786 [Trizodia sp. TS-e1964]|nr:MAG: hypothetical protein M1829_000786 [Trizodia sp. TS-e1964]